jgi:bifunctional DNA-binding transcriptional regulator/antitoxin component of YhaV-PrlF toxin-antitoxin module
MGDTCLGVGRYHIDQKGAGRIYIPKALVKTLDFKSGEQILIKSRGNRLEILKLEEGGSSRS